MRYNENYVIKKTLLGRLYLANQETGDVVDVNPITVDNLENIKKSFNKEKTTDKGRTYYENVCGIRRC